MPQRLYPWGNKIPVPIKNFVAWLLNSKADADGRSNFRFKYPYMQRRDSFVPFGRECLHVMGRM